MRFMGRVKLLRSITAVIVLSLSLAACGGVVSALPAGERPAPPAERPPGEGVLLQELAQQAASSEEDPGQPITEIMEEDVAVDSGGERLPEVVGPSYIAGFNPLTGLPVEDVASLQLKPLLVSVSNFPPSARPQCGLSLAAQVWETYIAQGMTRLLPVYYGDYAAEFDALLANPLVEGGRGYVIGPVRSGRVVYEDIKTLFPGAFLITAGASSEVAAQLSNRSSVYSQDPDDINAAGVGAEALGEFEGSPADPADYAGLVFGAMGAVESAPAEAFRLIYNLFNQVGWTYDPSQGAYLRSQDVADGSGELHPATECLTGEQLAFENVVVLWAQHRYVTETIVEMELVYVRDRYGLLFRDGEVVEIRWSTPGGKLQIHDVAGNPIPLKPGRTFFEVVSYETTWNAEETVVRFHNPPYDP